MAATSAKRRRPAAACLASPADSGNGDDDSSNDDDGNDDEATSTSAKRRRSAAACPATSDDDDDENDSDDDGNDDENDSDGDGNDDSNGGNDDGTGSVHAAPRPRLNSAQRKLGRQRRRRVQKAALGDGAVLDTRGLGGRYEAACAALLPHLSPEHLSANRARYAQLADQVGVRDALLRLPAPASTPEATANWQQASPPCQPGAAPEIPRQPPLLRLFVRPQARGRLPPAALGHAARAQHGHPH